MTKETIAINNENQKSPIIYFFFDIMSKGDMTVFYYLHEDGNMIYTRQFGSFISGQSYKNGISKTLGLLHSDKQHLILEDSSDVRYVKDVAEAYYSDSQFNQALSKYLINAGWTIIDIYNKHHQKCFNCDYSLHLKEYHEVKDFYDCQRCGETVWIKFCGLHLKMKR